MRDGARWFLWVKRLSTKGGRLAILLACLALLPAPGCATMRRYAPTRDLRPCSQGWAYTADGWKLGVRRYRPKVLDPGKLPVVLCHGLGLNATFWTITDSRTHLPEQLVERGYDVFVFDFRGSGESAQIGPVGKINALMRQTFLLEFGERSWTIDDIIRYDVPAVLDYVKLETGHDRVNWVGHSLGGMMMFPYLELTAEPDRIANLVAMGSAITFADLPETKKYQYGMLRANRALRKIGSVMSPGRLGRPLMLIRFPGLENIDKFYYTAENVDRRTVKRFYGYTLEDTGRGALEQLDPYLEFGRFLSSDRTIDYTARLNEVKAPLLMVAGDGDILSDVPSTILTFNPISSPDKTLKRFGKAEGHVADYGHCDLVWSRYASSEIFPPIIDWLDERQPAVKPSAQKGPTAPESPPDPPAPAQGPPTP